MSNYYQVDRERWAKMTINEQMGNIGSEVGRAIIAFRNGKKDRVDRAIDRAIDLFSATAEALVGTKHSYRLKEVLRAREEFLRLFFDGTFESDADKIERYFMNYAFAARHEHMGNQTRERFIRSTGDGHGSP